MGFELFDRSKAAYGRKPNVTIQLRGIFSINQSAYRRLGEPRFVELLYDAESKLIGLRPTENEKTGHKVRLANQPGASAAVSATAFTKYYDIDTTRSLRWEPSFENGMLVIDLKVPGRPIGRKQNIGSEDDDQI